MFAERALVAYVVQNSGSTVYTDPTTLTRVRLLLEFEGVADRVVSAPAPAGALLYVNMKNIERCRSYGRRCKWGWEDYVPRDGWIEQARIEPKRRLGGILLSRLGLDKIIPKGIFDRLDRPNSSSSIYLTGLPRPREPAADTLLHISPNSRPSEVASGVSPIT